MNYQNDTGHFCITIILWSGVSHKITGALAPETQAYSGMELEHFKKENQQLNPNFVTFS